MTLRNIGIPTALLVGGILLVFTSLQLMMMEILMLPAIGLLGLGGLAGIYGFVWLAETVGERLRAPRHDRGRRR